MNIADLNWVKIGTSSTVAFFISIFICFSIEIFGGSVGGILGSAPNTVIPSSFAIMTDGKTDDDSLGGVFAFSIGAFCSGCVYLPVWFYVPGLLSKKIPRGWRLTMTLIIAILAWSIVGIFFTWLQTMLPIWGIPIIVLSPILTLIIMVVGVCICWVPPESPKGKKKVSIWTHIARGLVVAAVIFIALIISQLGSSGYAGLFSAFPIILSVTMVSVSLAQDDEVVRGSIGPLILGNPANSIYCYVTSLLYVYAKLDPYLCCFIGFCAGVLIWSLPSYYFIQWRLRVKHRNMKLSPVDPEMKEKENVNNNDLNQEKKGEQSIEMTTIAVNPVTENEKATTVPDNSITSLSPNITTEQQ
ncbi:hypothetical protein WA158_000696 [Blastocystis sp. Blastoise]